MREILAVVLWFLYIEAVLMSEDGKDMGLEKSNHAYHDK